MSDVNSIRKIAAARIILLLYCILAGDGVLHAQTYNYRHYSVEQGLASTIVYMACQDSKGYIWFATEEGVSRFDGKTFVNFTMDDGLADNDILRIYADSRDRIWFFAFNGRMSYYHNGKIHNALTDPYLKELQSGSPFLDFFEDSRGRLWFGRYSNSVSVLSNGRVRTVILPDMYPDAGTLIEESEDGDILVSYMIGKYRIDTVSYKPVFLKKINGAADARFFNGESGANYYYNDLGLFKSVNGNPEKISGYNKLLQFNKLITITDDKSDIYISTWNQGVYRFDSTLQVNGNTRNYLPRSIVNSVFTDNERNVWFMTRYEGVYQLPAQAANVEVYRKPQLKEEQIYSIYLDKESNIWLGCGENFLTCITKDTTVNFNLKAHHNSSRVISITADRQGYIWGGGDNGFFKVVSKKPIRIIEAVPENSDSLSILRVLNITFNSENQGFATMPYHTLSVTDNDGYSFKSFFKQTAHSKESRNFFGYYDKSDRLYLADASGLNEVRNDKLFPVLPDNSLMRSRIVCLAETDDSVLVAATDGNGLIFYKDGRMLKHLTRDDGLSSNTCRRMFIDGNRIYVCTNKGVSAFTFSNRTVSAFTYYNNYNGLVSNEARDVFADNEHVYVATAAGLSVLKPEVVNRLSEPPPVYINQMMVNDKVADRISGMTINSGDKLSLGFIAVTFSNPVAVTYQYRVRNTSESAWVTVKDNFLDFYNLPAGDIGISIRAKKIDSDWSKPVEIKLRVAPPFYRTWWFISSAVLAGLIFISLLAGYFYRKKMRRQLAAIEKIQMLNTERTRISADMHDDLGSDFSRIAVLAELTRFSLADKPESQSLVKNISELVQSSRQKMDEIIWALNPSNDTTGDLIAYCNEYAYNYLSGSDIRVHLNTEQEIPDLLLNARQRRNIFLVIKEILNNVLKHSKAADFYLTFGISDDILQIIASDNGQGFDQQQTSNRNGLRNICNRLNEIGGKADIVSSPGNGTSYVIHLKLARS